MTTSNAAKLAIDGGPKAFAAMTGKNQPKLGVAELISVAERFGFTPAAIDRLRAALSNNDLASSPHLGRYFPNDPSLVKGTRLEAMAREKFGVRHALSVSSGTGALHSAFVAAGAGPGREVIVPALGFAATAAAVALAGAVPVFCDVDDSLHMDPAKVESLVTPRTVAMAPTHHWGGVADMDSLCRIARKNGLKVVEDCAESPGATYRGKYVGTLGDLGCFSISAYKIIGGGEGGMVVTNDQRLFERACQLAEFGGLWRANRFAPPRYAGELFVGSNYRMSELEAAVDLVQLGKLDDIVARHRRVNQRIRRQLKNYRQIAWQRSNDGQGEIGYVLRFFPETFELSAKIAAALAAEGIGCATRGKDHKPDWHLCSDMFPITAKTGHIPGGSVFDDPRNAASRIEYTKGSWPVAEDLYAREVLVGLNQWHSDEDCDNVASGINKVLDSYCTRK